MRNRIDNLNNYELDNNNNNTTTTTAIDGFGFDIDQLLLGTLLFMMMIFFITYGICVLSCIFHYAFINFNVIKFIRKFTNYNLFYSIICYIIEIEKF